MELVTFINIIQNNMLPINISSSNKGGSGADHNISIKVKSRVRGGGWASKCQFVLTDTRESTLQFKIGEKDGVTR